MITLLSPAKNKEVAVAAIQAGADAIYIGAPAFGAREKAGNSIEDLAEVVQYAHTYGVHVLVTVNTLLHEDEYPQAVKMIEELYRIGVDALIIQDLHLLDFNLPPIRLHASTQCDNRTPEQVAFLRDLGFKRVVLARELRYGPFMRPYRISNWKPLCTVRSASVIPGAATSPKCWQAVLPTAVPARSSAAWHMTC